MTVTIAKSAGFCFGVERAVRMCREAAERYGRCVTYGEIIHNKTVTDELSRLGVTAIHDISAIPDDAAVVIRSHGISKAEYSALEARRLTIIDATCPFVAKIHRIVRDAEAEGRLPVIFGQKEHAELRGVAGQVSRAVVFGDGVNELETWLKTAENREKPLTAVYQTTLNRKIYDKTCEILKKVCTNVKIYDTICAATQERQSEARGLAGNSDIMVVVGDAGSANSRGLFEIAAKHCPRAYFIEGAEGLPDFGGEPRDIRIGVTAGASTPVSIIEEVIQKMFEEAEVKAAEITEPPAEAAETAVPENPAEGAAVEITAADEAAAEETTVIEIVAAETAVSESDTEAAAAEAVTPADEVSGQESFEEMLERSIKTLHTGERVTGIVAAITPTEVSVDLGIKQSGYIPLSELTDDPSKAPDEIVAIGDKIEAFVMRVNDVEGTVQLSRRRIDAIRNWADIETAMNERTVVEGVVTEENKGGVVVMVRGVRVFVPASRTGLPREAPMAQLVKQNVRLYITEVDQRKRRVVGSISDVAKEERKARSEQVWTGIEAGKRYRGIVKSLTSFGAFIDIGGVDGMAHVTELSWTKRPRQPSDALSVGEEVDVYVVSFDAEKRKISLSCKLPEENPWEKFKSAYKIGDVVSAKVVKLMTFGAFAEIIPGVDGLIHVSQVTDHRIGAPGDILHVGDVVDVKITDIIEEKQQIALSIRALMAEPQAVPEDGGEPEVVYDTENPEAYAGGAEEETETAAEPAEAE